MLLVLMVVVTLVLVISFGISVRSTILSEGVAGIGAGVFIKDIAASHLAAIASSSSESTDWSAVGPMGEQGVSWEEGAPCEEGAT